MLCLHCYRHIGIAYNELCFQCYKKIGRIPQAKPAKRIHVMEFDREATGPSAALVSAEA